MAEPRLCKISVNHQRDSKIHWGHQKQFQKKEVTEPGLELKAELQLLGSGHGGTPSDKEQVVYSVEQAIQRQDGRQNSKPRRKELVNVNKRACVGLYGGRQATEELRPRKLCVDR